MWQLGRFSKIRSHIICHNTWSHKVACGTIQGCATNKNYYCINVVSIQIVPQWDSNWECSINRGNTVIDKGKILKLCTAGHFIQVSAMSRIQINRSHCSVKWPSPCKVVVNELHNRWNYVMYFLIIRFVH